MASSIDFYALPRPVQERFAAATRLAAPPAPLLFRPAPRTLAWACLAAAVALLTIDAVLLSAGFGQAESRLALHRPQMLAVDALLLAGAAYGVLHAVGVLLSLEGLPWRPGLYLFPGCIIDATRAKLDVWRIEDVASVERVRAPLPGVAFVMRDGGRVVVPAASDGQADRAYGAIEAVRRDEARAIEDEDSRVMAELDPLHDRAMSSPIGPTEAMKRQVPLWMRIDWAIAAIVGVLLAEALGATRNAMSDEKMYNAAVAQGTSGAYEAYLSHRGKHDEEVREVLLPRVELRQAEAAGTVDAIREFARSHPDSKIAPEVDASLRRALLVELEKAKKAGTVTALDAFARAYPEPAVDAELKAARHALFVAAVAGWRAKAHPDPAADAFVTKLVAWSEKNAKPVEIRFRPRPMTTIENADRSVMHNVRYPGPDALPSRYVTPDAIRPNEQAVIDAVVTKFADSFPADVLSARAADPLGPDDPAPPNVAALVVDESVEWSHGNTMCPKPPTVFIGLSFAFDAAFSVPDAPPPLKMSVKSWRAAESWKFKPMGVTLPEFEEKVYGAMIAGAFDQLRRKLVDVLF